MLSFLGGTGPEGKGLALRFAMAGNEVLIGSRDPTRAVAAVEHIKTLQSSVVAHGMDNDEAAKTGDIIFIAVPMAGHKETISSLRDQLRGKLVIDVTAPIMFQGNKAYAVPVDEGSLALQTQSLLPDSMVASTFHHISASDLLDPAHTLNCDVLVCATNGPAKSDTISLVSQIPGIRPIDGGDLTYSRYAEEFTAVLVNINRIYKGHSSVKFLGI